MLKEVLHTGIGVNNLEASVELYTKLGFTIRNKFEKPEPSASVVTVEKDGAAYELWKFHDTDHPQVEFIKNHIAIYSDDLENDVKALEEQGYTVVIPITVGVTLKYAFLRDPAGATYEIGTAKEAS